MKRRTNALTIIEILIAVTILSLFMFVVYKIYFGMSRSFEKGSWQLNAQNKLRNALTFIREEMQKAAYKSEATLSGVTLTEPGYEFHVNAPDDGTEKKITSGTIAKWHICIPFSDIPQTMGADYECILKLENGKITYTKNLKKGSSNEKTYSNHTIIKNVKEVIISRAPFDPDKLSAGEVITIGAKVCHPDKVRFPNAYVKAQTGAKVEIKVDNSL